MEVLDDSMSGVDFMYLFSRMEWIGNTTYQSLLWLDILDSCLDPEFFSWLLWLFTPVIMMFLLPGFILFLIYLSVLFLHIYRHRHRLKDAYARDFWDGARHTLATMWDAHGYIWHGYEVIGMENIPDEGSALLVYYHGALPIDFYYLHAKCILHKRRLIQAVGDRFLFMIPGWKLLMDVLKVFPGTVQGCAHILRDGNLLSIAPGGVLEAQFGDENYNLLWGKRIGFAKVALEAKAPIIPVFTENLREAFRTPGIFRALFRSLYERTRMPLIPIYGGFPVKLRTHIGKPIPYDETITPTELSKKTAEAIEELIRIHQRIPGNILQALLDRVVRRKKKVLMHR